MQLAGHGIRAVIATLVAFTALATIAPATHGGATKQEKVEFWCPPLC